MNLFVVKDARGQTGYFNMDQFVALVVDDKANGTLSRYTADGREIVAVAGFVGYFAALDAVQYPQFLRRISNSVKPETVNVTSLADPSKRYDLPAAPPPAE